MRCQRCLEEIQQPTVTTSGKHGPVVHQTGRYLYCDDCYEFQLAEMKRGRASTGFIAKIKGRRSWAKSYGMKHPKSANAAFVQEAAIRASFSDNEKTDEIKDNADQKKYDDFCKLFGLQKFNLSPEFLRSYQQKRLRQQRDKNGRRILSEMEHDILEYGPTAYIDNKILIDLMLKELQEKQTQINDHVCLIRDDVSVLMLLWNNSHTNYFFVWTDYISNTIKESVNFRSRDNAFAAFRRDEINFNGIYWKAGKPFSTQPVVA